MKKVPDNLIVAKSKSLSANLRWQDRGKKRLFIEELIIKSLGRSCPYCKTALTLKNVSLDHKIPFESKIARKNKQEHYRLDIPQNLHLVCKRCNKVKGDLSDIQYRRLLRFLASDKHIERSVLKRLSQSYHIYH